MSPGQRREAVARAQAAYQVSERRSCTALSVARSSMRYASTGCPDTALRPSLCELARTRLTQAPAEAPAYRGHGARASRGGHKAARASRVAISARRGRRSFTRHYHTSPMPSTNEKRSGHTRSRAKHAWKARLQSIRPNACECHVLSGVQPHRIDARRCKVPRPISAVAGTRTRARGHPRPDSGRVGEANR